MAETFQPRRHIVVFSSLFPNSRQPCAGLFIRERMFRVGRELPISVVSPTPWFPLQGLIRLVRPGFRAGAPVHEVQQGIHVWFPRFVSIPGILKRLDGWAMALAAWPRLRKLKRAARLDLIDAHFAYPDGYAAALLGRWLNVPVTITLRGTEVRHARDDSLAPLLRTALRRANRIFAVSESLRILAIELGTSPDKVRVIGNGVDLEKFKPIPRIEARRRLNLGMDTPVLITVGALVERKGFHRVIELLPALRERFPGLTYLIVGGASPEGDWTDRLKNQAAALGLADAVRFLGAMPPEELRVPLSAANAFVLATRNEGRANVLLEAMGCGLPIVATDVGGNAEVLVSSDLGILVPFGDSVALRRAIEEALTVRRDPIAIRAYAERNAWDQCVAILLKEFSTLTRPVDEGNKRRAEAGHA